MPAPPASWLRFWQLLLWAELPVAKRQAILQRLPSNSEEAAMDALRGDPGLSDAERRRLESVKLDVAERAEREGITLLRTEDLSKGSLMDLPQVAALFVAGSAACLNAPSVALVGTRNFTPYGEAAARKFAEHLARAGVTVISGGAFGIDAAAHEGGLAAKGCTAAVLPSGVDRPYPRRHAGLFERVRERGCLLSQFPLGLDPREGSFVIRNATIAALADAVLIVEAPAKSGSIATASRASELGRPVYVVPGPIVSESFRGSHELIRAGATLVDHPDQILEDLHVMFVPESSPRGAPSSPEQERILNVLGHEPLGAEKISELTGLGPDRVMAELTMLELEGRIERTARGACLAP